jgi:hypothetical protein
MGIVSGRAQDRRPGHRAALAVKSKDRVLPIIARGSTATLAEDEGTINARVNVIVASQWAAATRASLGHGTGAVDGLLGPASRGDIGILQNRQGALTLR